MFNHAGVCIQVSLSLCLSFTLFFLESEDESNKNSQHPSNACARKVREKSYACGEAGLVKIRAEALLRLLGGAMKARRRAKGVKDMRILTVHSLFRCRL